MQWQLRAPLSHLHLAKPRLAPETRQYLRTVHRELLALANARNRPSRAITAFVNLPGPAVAHQNRAAATLVLRKNSFGAAEFDHSGHVT